MKRLLIVEDDAIIAFDLAEQLESAGFSIVGIATTLARGLALCEQCDAAVLDVNLGRETSAPIATRLTDLNTPFVAVSGYSRRDLPAAFAAAPLLGKPVSMEQMTSELHHLLCCRTEPN